jgi:UDPglucose 6-dehydrogenase
MKQKPTIGIIGHLGVVGSATFLYFKGKHYKVYGYDLREPKYKDESYTANIVFICVPTPFNWKHNKFDGSIVEEAIALVPEGRTVVLKSTVPIGTTDRLQKKHPKIKLVFNPEFLSELTSDQDFQKPDRQLIGYTKQSFAEAKKILALLPKSPNNVIMPAKEAELLKYINNIHGALAVVESNHYFEVCRKENLNYENVIKVACISKYMNPYYHVIMHKDYRGFGGKCFPKDVNSWIAYLDEKKIDSTLFKAVRDMNRRILKEQRLTEKLVEKK